MGGILTYDAATDMAHRVAQDPHTGVGEPESIDRQPKRGHNNKHGSLVGEEVGGTTGGRKKGGWEPHESRDVEPGESSSDNEGEDQREGGADVGRGGHKSPRGHRISAARKLPNGGSAARPEYDNVQTKAPRPPVSVRRRKSNRVRVGGDGSPRGASRERGGRSGSPPSRPLSDGVGARGGRLSVLGRRKGGGGVKHRGVGSGGEDWVGKGEHPRDPEQVSEGGRDDASFNYRIDELSESASGVGETVSGSPVALGGDGVGVGYRRISGDWKVSGGAGGVSATRRDSIEEEQEEDLRDDDEDDDSDIDFDQIMKEVLGRGDGREEQGRGWDGGGVGMVGEWSDQWSSRSVREWEGNGLDPSLGICLAVRLC